MREPSNGGADYRTARQASAYVLIALVAVEVLGAVTRIGPPIDVPATIAILATAAGLLAVDILETGRIHPREKAEIKSKVAGQVATVHVRGPRDAMGADLIAHDPG